MDRKVYATCLWPGLARLWFRGDFQGLLPAIVTTIAFNGLVLLRFVYPEMLSATQQVGTLIRLVGWSLVLLWVFAVVQEYRELPTVLAPRAVHRKHDRFKEAQQAFLLGNWLQAEQFLRETVSIEERDPPALLLLAAVYRRTGRIEEARQTLDLLGQLESGDAWYLELRAERQRLVRAI
jgi:uncharacterized protein HemY